METSFIQDGQAHGDAASLLANNGWDPLVLKPTRGPNGGTFIIRNEMNDKGILVPTWRLINNADATLRYDEWKLLDTNVLKAARERLTVFSDIVASGLTFNIPNGMGKTVLEYQTQSKAGVAQLGMDPVVEGENDRPVYDLRGLPLPVVSEDFSFSLRQLEVGRQTGTPLDTTMAEEAARNCAEKIERLTLGVDSSFAYGGYSIYGYRNFPQRITRTITAPTGGWTPDVLLTDLLAMRQDSIDANHRGPWRVYMGPSWTPVLDDDYSSVYPGVTVRDRMLKIDGINSIKTSDYLTGYDIIMVEMTSGVVRAVIGMNMTTVQWETHGGLKRHFKVMGILVPQLRSDYYDQTGIVHGSVA